MDINSILKIQGRNPQEPDQILNKENPQEPSVHAEGENPQEFS